MPNNTFFEEAERAEWQELRRFALLGQAFLGLAHDLNNALNSMMLQTSIVQMRADEKTRQELSAVRQAGTHAASMIRSLQRVALERREQFEAVDLNAAIAAVLDEDAEWRRRVALQSSGQAATILGTRGSVKQLVRLLLRGVLAWTHATVQLRTEKRSEGAVLSIVLEKATTTEDADTVSLTDALLWENLDDIECMAGQSLLRQLGGVLDAKGRTANGWIVRVEFGGV